MSLFFESYQREIMETKFHVEDELKESSFRRYIIQKKGKTLETIHLFKNSLASTLQKPQQCLYSDTDYYIALDIYTDTYYVCFRDLMMIDIDIPKEKTCQDTPIHDLPSLKKFLQKYTQLNPEALIEAYQTRNGYHLFLLHSNFDYHSDKAMQIMLDLHADFYYTIYSHLRGWSVRLNKKYHDVGDEDNSIYVKIGRFGTGKAKPHLEKLVALHLNLLTSFKDTPESRMR